MPAAGLADDVAARMPPLDQWRRFIYCNSLAGDVVGVVDHFPGQTTPLKPEVSPEPVAHLAQHKLLPLMAARAAAAPGVSFRMGHRLLRLAQGGEGMRVEVERAGGGSYSVDCQYLVAADGTRGTLRHQLGVSMGGPGAIQHLINIHFISPQVGRAGAVPSRGTLACINLCRQQPLGGLPASALCLMQAQLTSARRAGQPAGGARGGCCPWS